MQQVFQLDLADKYAAKRQRTTRACQRCRETKKRCSMTGDSTSCRRCGQDAVRCSFQRDPPSPLSITSGVLDSLLDFSPGSRPVPARQPSDAAVPAAARESGLGSRSGPASALSDPAILSASEMGVDTDVSAPSELSTADQPRQNSSRPSELRYSSMLDLLQRRSGAGQWWDSKLIGDSNPLSALLRKDIKHRIVTGMCDFRVPEPAHGSRQNVQRLAGTGAWDWEGFYSSRLNSRKFSYLQSLGCFELPQPDRIGYLLDIYFSRVHPMLPIVDRADLLSRLYGLGDAPPLVLLHAVFLAASRYASSNDRQHAGEIRDHCDRMHACVRALIEQDLSSNRPAVLRASLIASFHWEGREGVNSALDSLSLAVRIGQEMGLHRRRSVVDHAESEHDAVSRRIWWCLYAFDRFNAAQEGTPFLIDERDCDVDMLQPSDLQNEDPITRETTLFNITLSQIIEGTIRTLYGPQASAEPLDRLMKRDVLLSELNDLETRMENALRDAGLQSDSMRGFWYDLLGAHLRAVRILILRPFLLVFDPDRGAYSSWELARAEASQTISGLVRMKQHGLLRFSWPFTVYAIVSALLIVWYDLSSSAKASRESNDSSSARCQFLEIIGLLKEMGHTWWAAAAKHKLSEALLRVANASTLRLDRSATHNFSTSGPLGDTLTPVSTSNDVFDLSDQGSFSQDMLPDLNDAAFWNSLGLDFENEVASNVFSIFQTRGSEF